MKLFLVLLLLSFHTYATPRFRYMAIDLLVLFDPRSIDGKSEVILPGKGAEFMNRWRMKLLEETLVYAAAGKYRPYQEIIEDSLDFTSAQMGLQLTSESRKGLLGLWRELSPWEDSISSLQKLHKAGVKLITLANFPAGMVSDNLKRINGARFFFHLLSSEQSHSLKPNPQAYGLALKEMRAKKEDILYVAFSDWDAFGAKSFGYPTYRVFREKNWNGYPEGTIDSSPDLAGLLKHVLGEQD